MGPKNMDKKLSSRKERVDREEQTKYKFDPLRLEVKYPGTAILLLQCQEKPILLAAAVALDKFAIKSQENVEILFDLNIVDSVVPLIEHEDLFTRRFAAKLLAEMTAISCVRNYILESDHYIAYFTKVLINEKDTFMQEFSSLILAELSKDMYGAAQLLKQCPTMDFLFERIQSADPDVKKNNIEIMYNLLQDPTGAKEIIETKDFDLGLIYDLFNSPYPEIQRLALDVIGDFVVRNQDEHLQETFRQTKGLQALLNFLDNGEWQDLHAEVLRVLSLASDNPKTAEFLDDIGGTRRILKYLEDTPNSKLFLWAFDVAVRLSHIPSGRKALHTYGIVEYLLHTLRGNVQPDIYEISCHGIGMMALYNPAAMELTAENCVKNILDVLKNENLKWSSRQAAVFALNELLKYDRNNCDSLLESQGQNYLLWLIKQPTGKVPVEVQVNAVEALTTIAGHPTLRNIIINGDTIDALCSSFESTCPSTSELKIASCNTLSIFCIEKIGRDAFLKERGPSRLYNLLSDSHSIPTRNAAVQLVQLLSTDSVLSNAFVEAKFLAYMVNNRSSARMIPSWDTCIEALFDSHLPIKFAFTGRLSLKDVTQDGFYVMRRNICPFPVLEHIFRFKFCPMEPVYVVNCIRPRQTSLPDGPSEMIHEESKTSVPRESSLKGIFLSAENVDIRLDLKFGRLQCDPYLYEYVELFKCKLIAAERKDTPVVPKSGLVNIRYVASRAKMLAKFVVQQLCGPDPVVRCIDHQLEIHLKEIKDSIETSVIPLGMLRVGSYLERALLFKVIADRIGLPAALVRGEYGKAWIEISVPQTDPPEEDSSFDPYLRKNGSCPEFITIKDSRQFLLIDDEGAKETATQNDRGTIFPTKLMKPNFIVDLMHVPGNLIPIGSHRAKLYCEKQLVCEPVCCN